MNAFKAMIKTALILSFCIPTLTHAVRYKSNPGEPVYCDTSAGRVVLNNGSYSKLFCRYNAVMDFKYLHACCSWAGGVFMDKQGNVICRNGSISPVCSLQNHEKDFEMRTDDTVELKDHYW